MLHIEFKWIKPSIWRRVAVPENITLSKLHQVIVKLRCHSLSTILFLPINDEHYSW